MEITLVVNGLDLSRKLSTYNVQKEITYKKVVTTMDNVDHPYPGAAKDIVSFSLLPMTELEGGEVYAALSPLVIDTTYTSQYEQGAAITKRVRVTSSLESQFLLMSVDGKRRYRGGEIQLKEL